MREALKSLGAPEDLLLCVERPSIPLANELMSICDLTIATGGPAMVKAAYSSGKPAYGVGAGNATMVIDETADIEDAARNTRISKTNDHGSGCSADGNLLVDASIYDRFLDQSAARRRLSRQRTGEAAAAEGLLGRRGPAHRRHHRAPGVGGRGQGRHRAAGGQDLLHRAGNAHRQGPSVLDREARRRALDHQVPRLRRCARQGAADLRDRRQGPLLRHLLVQRRPHPPAGAGRAGEPDDGAAGAVALQRRHVHQRDADDVEHGLRRLGRQHHQREHRAQALHERDVGEPADRPKTSRPKRSSSASSTTARSRSDSQERRS